MRTCRHKFFTQRKKTGSVGTPIKGIDIKIYDKKNHEVPAGEIGEIVIQGSTLMKGCFNNCKITSDAFQSNSWFRTGDLGKKDEDGYIYIVDKVKNMVNRGGFEVYPRQIEKILMTYNGVSEVMAVSPTTLSEKKLRRPLFPKKR